VEECKGQLDIHSLLEVKSSYKIPSSPSDLATWRVKGLAKTRDKKFIKYSESHILPLSQ
jgi:hypothetical protein